MQAAELTGTGRGVFPSRLPAEPPRRTPGQAPDPISRAMRGTRPPYFPAPLSIGPNCTTKAAQPGHCPCFAGMCFRLAILAICRGLEGGIPTHLPHHRPTNGCQITRCPEITTVSMRGFLLTVHKYTFTRPSTGHMQIGHLSRRSPQASHTQMWLQGVSRILFSASAHARHSVWSRSLRSLECRIGISHNKEQNTERGLNNKRQALHMKPVLFSV